MRDPVPYLVTLTLRQRRNPGVAEYTLPTEACSAAEAIANVKRTTRAAGWIQPPRAPRPQAVRAERWYFLKTHLRFVGPEHASGRVYPLWLRVKAKSADEARRGLAAKIAAGNRRRTDGAWRLGDIKAVLLTPFEARVHERLLVEQAESAAKRATQTQPKETVS